MLTYPQVALALHKWAFKYQSNDFEYWELINAVWAKGDVQKLEHEQFISGRVKWDMIDYMRSIHDFRRDRRKEAADKHIERQYSMNQLLDNAEIGDFIENKTAEPVQSSLETKDYFDWLARGLSKNEAILLKMRFIDEQKLKDIALILNMTESRVSQVLSQLLIRLKHKLTRNNYNHANRVCTLRHVRLRDKDSQLRYNRDYYKRNALDINYRRKLRREEKAENKKNFINSRRKAELVKN